MVLLLSVASGMAESELDFLRVWLRDLMREKPSACANASGDTEYDLTSLREAWDGSPGGGDGTRVAFSYSES